MEELLNTRWDKSWGEAGEWEPEPKMGRSWWKNCGYNSACKEAMEEGFKKGFTPYAMEKYKYLW